MTFGFEALGEAGQRALLDFLYRSFSNDIALFSGLDLAESGIAESPPLRINDLDGSALFLDYTIVDRDGGKRGVLRSSGRGTALPPVDAIMIGQALFDPAKSAAAAIAEARSRHPGAEVEHRDFVCYGYPRVGVRLRIAQGVEALTAVYDAHTGYLVRETKAVAESGMGEEAGDVEGQPFYSLLRMMPEAGPGGGFGPDWQSAMRAAIIRPGRRPLSMAERRAPREAMMMSVLAETRAARAEPIPAMSGSILPVSLIGQETPVYCAVASGKMILEYLGFAGHTQSKIAAAFQTAANGTTNANMEKGLATLTGGRWRTALDISPTPEEASSYLGAFVPGKSGIPGHARVLRGWREYSFFDPAAGSVVLRDRYYLINDPYPVNSGQLTLENVRKPVDDFFRNLLMVRRPD